MGERESSPLRMSDHVFARKPHGVVIGSRFPDFGPSACPTSRCSPTEKYYVAFFSNPTPFPIVLQRSHHDVEHQRKSPKYYSPKS